MKLDSNYDFDNNQLLNYHSSKKLIVFTITAILSISSFSIFLVLTQAIWNPLVAILLSLFLIFPYRKESDFAKRMILLFFLFLFAWVLADMGTTLIPFGVSFLLAYLIDPLVEKLQRKGIPRWVSSLVIILFFIGIVSVIAILVFPILFAQLYEAIPRISNIVESVTKYLNSNKFYRLTKQFGLDKETLKPIITTELIPRMESLLKLVLQSLLTFLTNLSGIATQIINAIITPILLFYFLKDFAKLRRFTKNLLRNNNTKLIRDLERISSILRKYISWQIVAAFMVACFCSLFFYIFGIPYPIVLGLICGLLNPIPTVGMVISMALSFIAVIIFNPDNILNQSLYIAGTVLTIHFVNAYLIEPNILGKQVGLHPVLLLASLFVFGGLFGFIGLLIAVPSTAILMMFFNDWAEKVSIPK